ncbi:MAG: HAMP domain-containing histidine kinase [Chloroflexi bacterium]|nr:HAMP domain-containing histidine kinase [Chloroflexota bacterium]
MGSIAVDKPETEEEVYRREAMGAFAHEVRTPLTSIRMVIELARRETPNEGLVLDSELAAMLITSIDDLQQLADDIQEASRLERHKLLIGRGPCDLHAAVETAEELLQGDIAIAGSVPKGIDGAWDLPRVVRAIAGFTRATNRIGDGSGSVRLDCAVTGDGVRLRFTSGTRAGEPKPVAADAGFGFFQSRLFVLAIGGTVEWERSNRYFSVTACLPLE